MGKNIQMILRGGSSQNFTVVGGSFLCILEYLLNKVKVHNLKMFWEKSNIFGIPDIPDFFCCCFLGRYTC